jgi:hypothetical protein
MTTSIIPAGSVSPLRQRLITDMTMRRFSAETQRNYLHDVRRLASFLGRSPDTASVEDLRRLQIRTPGGRSRRADDERHCLAWAMRDRVPKRLGGQTADITSVAKQAYASVSVLEEKSLTAGTIATPRGLQRIAFGAGWLALRLGESRTIACVDPHGHRLRGWRLR